MTKTLKNPDDKIVFSLSKSKVIIYIIIVSSMILLRDIFDVSLSKYLFVAICGIFFLAAKTQDLICMIMFTVPLLCGLPGNYIMPIALICYLFKSGRINSKQLLLSCFVIVMELVACVFYSTVSLPNIVGYITNLVLFFCLIYDTTKHNYKKYIYYFVLGVVLTAGIIVIATILDSPTWLQDISKGYLRFGMVENESEELLNITLNANALAFYSMTGISCIVVLLRFSEFNKLFLIIQMIFLGLVGLITLSRTWVLTLVLLLVLYVFASATSGKSVFKACAGLGIVALVVIVILNRYPQLYQGMLNRFNEGNLLNGNGRIEITSQYLSEFDENLRTMFFGTGVTDYKNVIGLEKSLHNSLVQILICYGIFGSLIFMYGWLSDVVKKIGKVKLFYWIPFICIFAYSLTAQVVNPHYLIYPHLLAIFSLNLGIDKATIFEKRNGI